MSDLKTYTGSCHCGNVRFQAHVDLGQPVISCNCSMCGRAGHLLTFIPAAQFELLSGQDSLTDYLFNKHVIHHPFCKVCGIKPFARGKSRDGSDTVGINARCLEGVEVASLKIVPYDGRSK
jgi:hypothetical protein